MDRLRGHAADAERRAEEVRARTQMLDRAHLLLGVSLDSQVFHTEEVQGVHSSGPAVRPGQHRSRIIAVPHSHQPEGLRHPAGLRRLSSGRVSSAGVPPESAPAPAETSPSGAGCQQTDTEIQAQNRHHFFMKHRLLCLYSRQRRRFGSTSGAIFIPLGEHEAPAPSAPLCPVPAAGEAGIPVPQTADG